MTMGWRLVVLLCAWGFASALVARRRLQTPPRRGTVRGAEEGGKAAEPDFVEKLFGLFFGKVEEEPYGLRRMSVETYPDQYPADVSGAHAEPLEADDGLVRTYVRPLMKQTFLEQREVTCLYDADRDGWAPRAFHAKVDKQGPGILLCESVDGQWFGGYNSKGWVGYGEHRPGLANFLFKWDMDGDFVKLQKVGGAGMATVDMPELGPSFGAEGLRVPLIEGSRIARVKLGAYYSRMPGTDANTFLDRGEQAVQLKSMRVYFAVYEPGEYVPFDDALPFSLT